MKTKVERKSSMEEAKLRKLGRGPSKAPNVQELAKQQLATIPPQYIQDNLEKTSYYNSSMLLPQIPVIDMEQLLHGHDHDSELDRLHFACKEWGFFQVVNRGVSISLMEKVKSEIQAFFDLPLEEKKKFEQQEGSIEGFGHDFVFSEEQKLDWIDLFYMDTLEAHSQEFKNLAISILNQMAKALKMDEKEMRDLYTDGMQLLRMNYYPPCPEPDRTYGLNPHSNTDALTILMHLNETEGLQVRKDNTWVPVKSLPNALIVNIGDMME
ncbi:protein SRG1-like, partial [Capsicum annuum]|uniref:protein SRG1-like n=1 Tax=Capsicum annuum TaxID=4072 RepID=UPI001FB06768